MKQLELIIKELALPAGYYDRLTELLEEKQLPQKEYLLRTGQVCTFIGVVEEGVLRSFREQDGEEFISDFYVPGSFVTSYRSFLRKEPSVGAIQALEDTTLSSLSYANFELLTNESPLWFKFGKHIADTLFVKKCVKDTSLLKDSALERYRLLVKNYPGIEQHVAQYHIASYLGIKPESLSRIKSLNIGQ